MKSDDIDRIIEGMSTDKNSLRKAAEMALQYFEDAYGLEDEEVAIKEALRQALAHEALDEMVAENQRLGLYDTHTCKTHLDAPHGFDRNASHNLGRYVCECEFWEPVDAVNMTPDRVDETSKGEHEPLCYLRDDIDRPFGGFEHCGEHDPGAFPVYLAPPKRDSSSWVGLTPTEFNSIKDTATTIGYAITKTEAMLKEKNT